MHDFLEIEGNVNYKYPDNWLCSLLSTDYLNTSFDLISSFTMFKVSRNTISKKNKQIGSRGLAISNFQKLE